MTATLQIKKNRPNYFIVLRYWDEQQQRKRQKWINTEIPVKGNNKRLAERKLNQVLAEYQKEHLDLSNNVLFTEFLKQWLETMKYSLDAVTFDTYTMNIYRQIIPYFEPKKLKVSDITPMHIQQYVNFRLTKVSPNTVRKHIFNISKCLDSAVKQNIIAVNPAKRIEMPKKVKYTGASFYDEDQIAKLLEAIKGEMIEPIIIFALFYGLRKSEILGIKWDAVNFTRGTITIKHTIVRVDKTLHKKDTTKNKSSYRVMPMPEFIKSILKSLKRCQSEDKLRQPNDYINEGYVFTWPDGRLISPNYVTHRFSKILKAHNLPKIRFHDLRHSAASYLLYMGCSMKEIQIWLGHGDISTTMNIYAHLDISAKQSISDNLSEKFASFGL